MQISFNQWGYFSFTLYVWFPSKICVELLFCAKIELYSQTWTIIKAVKYKEKVSVNLVLAFRQFNVFQFISVQFNIFHMLKFDSLLERGEWNLIYWKLSFVFESFWKVLKILGKLSSYKIFIIPELPSNKLDFGKGWLELRIFAAKVFSSIHYSLEICSNKQKKKEKRNSIY